MRLTTVGHCVQITFFPGVFPVNCYLVKEHDGATLIDAALPTSASAILQAAESAGVRIKRILLTHGHADHTGALDRLHTVLPEAEVMVSARDSRLLQGDVSLDDCEPQTKIRGGIPACQTRPIAFVSDGDRIGSIEVVACPGHTPGHLAYLDVRDRVLIAGDAFQVQGGVAVSGTLRPFFPFPAMATWHKEIALESAKRLRDFKPSYLAVGHGNVLARPSDAMDRAIDTADKTLRRAI